MLTFSRPLRVAVLCSFRSPGIVHLLQHDPRHGIAYRIVCAVTSEERFAEQAQVEAADVPVLVHSMAAFAAARGVSRGDRGARADYDRQTVALLAPYRPDVVVLDGYLLMLTAPMLTEYRGRIINLHHSDLEQRRDGLVRYPGLRAVRDAILAGERETRVSAHLVTATLDDGPVLLRSWAFPVPEVVRWARAAGAQDVLKSAVWAHQEWMLREAWGPMLAGALEMASLGIAVPGDEIDPVLACGWVLTRDGRVLPDAARKDAA
jgi:folate-dependent phosphoribosylglycinamide formyltransferase PurN